MPANSNTTASVTAHVNARGMKCPWPALRAARAMRSANAVVVEADDPIAAGELEAVAQQQGWSFEALGGECFSLVRLQTEANLIP